MENQKARALVTGASRGLGKAIARALLDGGYTVIGTSRNPQAISPENIVEGVEYLPLDLSIPESIEKLAQMAGEVDVLINNAGISQIGPVEEAPLDRVRYHLEVNIIGLIHLTKLIVRGMRERKRGCIINVTSFAGRITVPFASIYAAGKHAVEGFSKGLRHEVMRYGIKVIVVAPLHINTAIRMEKMYEDDSPYITEVKRVKAARDAGIAAAPSPEWMAGKIVKILKMKRPLPAYPMGRKAFFIAYLMRVMPETWVQSAVRKIFNVDG
ncbi:MAG: SDR family oxidoreductase [Proteobacteria bacterium]|nr:SDR family oxidoreductase [Pseudomonadota bacterium]